MPHTAEELIRLIASASAFALVLALWCAGMILWGSYTASRRRALHQRLGIAPEGDQPERVLRLWREGGATTTVRGRDDTRSLLFRIRRAHLQAGIASDVEPVIVGVGGAMVIAAAAAYVMSSNVVFAAAVPAFILMGYTAYIRFRVSKREALFERQFVHALELAARSLRAGHPLLGAFHLIAEELDAPVSTAFAEICQQHDMGVKLEDALERVSLTSTSQDLRLFATSVAIQLRSGGNLADMMERLAFVIRDRLRLGRRIRVLTSQTQFSKRVLVSMPFIMFLVLGTVNPDYTRVFYESTEGAYLLGFAAILMVAGMITMNKMAALRY